METTDNITIKDPANFKMINTPSLIKYLPHILLYPFQDSVFLFITLACLYLWIMIAVLYWTTLLTSPFIGMALPLLAMTIPPTVTYAYAILQHTAMGSARPPVFKPSMLMNFDINLKSLDKKLINQFIQASLINFMMWLNGLHYYLLTFFVLSLIIFFIPLNIATMALHNNLWHAFNPFFLIRFVIIIGREYFLLLLIFLISLILFMIFIKILFTLHFMEIGEPIASSFAIFNYIPANIFTTYSFVFLCFAALLISFHATGFVLYHRRHKLGLNVFISPEQELEKQQQAEMQSLNETLHDIYHDAHANRHQLALTQLFDKLHLLGDNLENNAMVFERMRLWNAHIVPNAHAQHYLNLLLKADKIKIALTVYQKQIKRHPNFKLEQPSALRALANRAWQQKQYALAFDLIADFSERYPKHPDKIAVQVLQVKLLIKLKRIQEAKIIIKQLQIAVSSQHVLFNEIRRYAHLLTKRS